MSYLKKVLKQIIRIPLALLLAFILSLTGSRIIEHINYIPSISNEEYITIFTENKEIFETVKNYVWTKDNGFSLNSQNYKGEVNDKNVKSALKFIFNQLYDSRVVKGEVDEDILFIYKPDYNTTKMIIYKEKPEGTQNYLDLGGNWYYNNYYLNTPDLPWEEVQKDFQKTLIANIIFSISVIVFFVVFYLLMGLIPYFKRQKNPSIV